MLRRLIVAVPVLLLSIAGCGGSDSEAGSDGGGGGATTGGSGGTGTGGGTGGTAGAANGGGTGGGPTCAPVAGYTSTDPPHLVGTVNATIQDLDGSGASNVLAQACGLDICINGSTNENGEVVTCDEQTGVCAPGIAVNQPLKRPALKYGDGFGYVKFAELLPTTMEDYDLGIRMTAKLPATSTGAPMQPGSDATSSGMKLTIAEGAEVEIDVLVYDTPEVQGFRATEIPIAKAPGAVDSSLNFEIIVGTTPIETKFCPRAKLSVPNSAGWPAGQAVEVFIHGVSVEEEWAPYAGWARVSDATVSADGQSVVTDDGDDQGIPYLSVFGFRAKP